jgi:hypothetical protein
LAAADPEAAAPEAAGLAETAAEAAGLAEAAVDGAVEAATEGLAAADEAGAGVDGDAAGAALPPQAASRRVAPRSAAGKAAPAPRTPEVGSRRVLFGRAPTTTNRTDLTADK